MSLRARLPGLCRAVRNAARLHLSALGVADEATTSIVRLGDVLSGGRAAELPEALGTARLAVEVLASLLPEDPPALVVRGELLDAASLLATAQGEALRRARALAPPAEGAARV